MCEGGWIDLECVADGHEGKRSVGFVVENPEPSFPEIILCARKIRFEIVLKTPNRIDKNGAHQAHDRLELSGAAPRRIKLRRHNGIEAKFVALTHRLHSGGWMGHDSPNFH